MPRLRQSRNTIRQEAFLQMMGRVSGGGKIYSDTKMCEFIGKTRRTYKNYCIDCSAMPIGDFWILDNKMDFTILEVISLLKGVTKKEAAELIKGALLDA